MPYQLKKSGSKYQVVNKNTGKVKNTKTPLSQERAKAYMRALYAHENG